MGQRWDKIDINMTLTWNMVPVILAMMGLLSINSPWR
jgi:hypothetical protein